MSSQPPILYLDPKSIDGDTAQLASAEGRHASKVLRLSRGDLIIAVDGLGTAYRSEITRVSRAGQVQIRIHSLTRNFGEPNVRLTLAAGLSAASKFDTVVEKGTELGVSRFVPILTEKSKVRVDDERRARTKVARYEKVALAAMKQSRRSFRPEITFPVAFRDYMKEVDRSSLSLLFHPAASTRYGDVDLPPDTKRINIIVGAESGFSDDEIELALGRDVRLVSLGRRILRTETAGPVICALVMNSLGELR